MPQLLLLILLLPLLLLPRMLELSALAAANPSEAVLSVSVLLPLPASMLLLLLCCKRGCLSLSQYTVGAVRSGSRLDMLDPSSLVLSLSYSLHARS